jgi:hypothetical protein
LMGLIGLTGLIVHWCFFLGFILVLVNHSLAIQFLL